MSDERPNETETPKNRIDVFLDGADAPVVSTTPPSNFELDTSRLADGPHVMRVEAYDSHGVKGVRTVHFEVRNGPGIAISGINQNDVLDGKIPVIVNAYGGTSAVDWEPAQAETPTPVPTWAWVMLILVTAFGLFYGVQQWSPTADFARTPTYGTFSTAAGPVTAAAAAAVPDGGAVADRAAADTSGAPQSLTPADATRGAALYSANCASCHQPTGQGLPGVFPPLAGNAVVTADDPTEHIQTVLNGKQGSTIDGVFYASPMPAFRGILNDADVAAIVNHERTSWDNAAPLVSAGDVAKTRE